MHIERHFFGASSVFHLLFLLLLRMDYQRLLAILKIVGGLDSLSVWNQQLDAQFLRVLSKTFFERPHFRV